MAVAAMQGADPHIRSSLGFSSRPGESNQRPSNNRMLALPLSHSRPWMGGGHVYLPVTRNVEMQKKMWGNKKQIKSIMKYTTRVTEDPADETSDLRAAMRRLWPSPTDETNRNVVFPACFLQISWKWKIYVALRWQSHSESYPARDTVA